MISILFQIFNHLSPILIFQNFVPILPTQTIVPGTYAHMSSNSSLFIFLYMCPRIHTSPFSKGFYSGSSSHCHLLNSYCYNNPSSYLHKKSYYLVIQWMIRIRNVNRFVVSGKLPGKSNLVFWSCWVWVPEQTHY